MSKIVIVSCDYCGQEIGRDNGRSLVLSAIEGIRSLGIGDDESKQQYLSDICRSCLGKALSALDIKLCEGKSGTYLRRVKARSTA